jgi:hypothetical protein
MTRIPPSKQLAELARRCAEGRGRAAKLRG